MISFNSPTSWSQKQAAANEIAQSCGRAQRMESALLAAERALDLSATRGTLAMTLEPTGGWDQVQSFNSFSQSQGELPGKFGKGGKWFRGEDMKQR